MNPLLCNICEFVDADSAFFTEEHSLALLSHCLSINLPPPRRENGKQQTANANGFRITNTYRSKILHQHLLQSKRRVLDARQPPITQSTNRSTISNQTSLSIRSIPDRAKIRQSQAKQSSRRIIITADRTRPSNIPLIKIRGEAIFEQTSPHCLRINQNQCGAPHSIA